MPQGYEGFAALGDVLSGGAGRRAEKEVPVRMKQNFDAFDALNKARISRAQALARDSLPEAIASSGLERPDLAASILGMASGQPNLGTLTEGYKDLGDIEIDRQIGEALERGDHTTARNLSAVKTDKVLPALGAGGKAVFTPVTGDVELTPLGDADVSATSALEAQRIAGAGASNARANASAITANAADVRARAYEADKLRAVPGAMGYEADGRDDFVAAFTADNGRPPTNDEIATVLGGGKLELTPLGEPVAIDTGTNEPVKLASATRTPAQRAWSADEVSKALDDARRAVATGKISRAEAQKRLSDAGLSNAAGRL